MALSRLNFVPMRFYWVNISKGEIRGNHAHKKLHQILFAINGQIDITLDDGNSATNVNLLPGSFIEVGPLIWRTFTTNEVSATIACFASEIYDENDYIREYQDFIKWRK